MNKKNIIKQVPLFFKYFASIQDGTNEKISKSTIEKIVFRAS